VARPRKAIGEDNVTERMKIEKAVIGGEGNGGVIYPRINFARDSQVGMALILHLLAGSGRTVSRSNTEPIIRVVAGAGSETAVRRIFDDVFGRVARIVGVG
jgi:phosphomannomutase